MFDSFLVVANYKGLYIEEKNYGDSIILEFDPQNDVDVFLKIGLINQMTLIVRMVDNRTRLTHPDSLRCAERGGGAAK